MKKLFYILSFLILVNSPLMATVLRVNNKLPENASLKIFATLLSANNAANPGDTLMIEGSPDPYPAVTITQKLVIIGTGYFLNENLENPSSQNLSIVQDITLNPTSEGSVLMGLYFLNNSNLRIRANNIVVQKCFHSSSIRYSGKLSGSIITQNYFDDAAMLREGQGTTFSGYIFKNNIVNGIFNVGNTNDWIFEEISNNIFLGTGNNTINVQTDNFSNNIIATNATSIIVISNNVRNNLLTFNNQLSGENNQIFDPTKLFVGATGNSTDGQYRLKENSPYKTAGFQGVEPGVFGGSSPYVLSGMPPFPIILGFSADSFGTQQNGLNVSIKAKTNN